MTVVISFIKKIYSWLAELLGGLAPVFLLSLVLLGYLTKGYIEDIKALNYDLDTTRAALETVQKEKVEAEKRFNAERDILERNTKTKEVIINKKCEAKVVVEQQASRTKGQEKVDEKDVLGSKLPDSIISLFK